MDEAKIRLSQKELELVSNTEWILTKNEVITKAKLLLGSVLDEQIKWLSHHKLTLPAEIKESSPKISKGENYRGLPYMVLDHPRLFDKEDVFALRTLFWWGNFFSTTLQLSGRYKRKFSDHIIHAYSFLAREGYTVSLGDDPWQHHFEAGNHIAVSNMKKAEFEKSIKEGKFIKLAQRVAIDQWNDATAILLRHFTELLKIIGNSQNEEL